MCVAFYLKWILKTQRKGNEVQQYTTSSWQFIHCAVIKYNHIKHECPFPLPVNWMLKRRILLKNEVCRGCLLCKPTHNPFLFLIVVGGCVTLWLIAELIRLHLCFFMLCILVFQIIYVPLGQVWCSYRLWFASKQTCSCFEIQLCFMINYCIITQQKSVPYLL